MRLRNGLAAAMVAAVLTCLIGVITATPAAAHSGGEAVARVQELTLEPSPGGGWLAKVEVVDTDSGEPIPGITLKLHASSGGESFGPVLLTPTEEDGVYGGSVTATPGTWTITVTGQQTPGGEQLREFSEKYHVELAVGEEAGIVENSMGTFWITVGVGMVLVVTVGIVLLVVMLRRGSRRTARRSVSLQEP